jgi:Zn-dependent protease with chaperone function
MVPVLRALASVVMLAGFYVVALAQLGAATALVIWLATAVAGVVAVKLAVPLFAATVGAVGAALWKAIRAKPDPPHGLLLATEAPRLWDEVHALSRAAGTAAPDEIRLVPEVNAAVQERSRLLGLIGGQRILYIGLPLLQACRIGQVRAVLAHELGHYSRRHTRLGEVAYRGRLAIGGTISRIGPRNPVGWVFKGYAWLYLLVDNASSRRQELEADEAAVRVAGRTAAASALRELPALDAAWAFYFRRYVEPGWEAGFAPADLFGGFRDLLAARGHELDALRAQEAPDRGSRWDTHPPIAERIAAIEAGPDVPVHPDGQPATLLLADVADAGRRLQELMIDVGQRQVLPWAQFTAAAIVAAMQRDADAVLRAASRFVGSPDAGLVTIFDLVARNQLGAFAEQFFPDATRREAAQHFATPMESLLQLAAVRSGVAFWQHSWSGPARLVDAYGREFALEEIAALAVSRHTVDEAWRRLAWLAVDPATVTLVERQASATGAGIIAGLANVKVDGVEHDLLVLDRGFVLVAGPGKADKGRQRLRELVGSAPPAELAGRHVFLPFEEVAGANIGKRVPARAELVLHDGRTITLHEGWSSELLEKGSRDTLLEVLGSFGPVVPHQRPPS